MSGLPSDQAMDIIKLVVGSLISGLGALGIAKLTASKKDISNLYKIHADAKSQLDLLQGEHDALCNKKHR